MRPGWPSLEWSGSHDRLRSIALSLATLAVLVGLALLPGPAGAAHLLLAAGAGALLLIGRSASSAGDTAGRAESLARLLGLADRIEHGIERLKDTQWELSDNAVRYRDLLDAQADFILRRDTAGRITFVNRAFCRVFAVTPGTILGKPFTLPLASGASGLVAEANPGEMRVVCLDTSGGRRWYELSDHAVPGADNEGEETQTVGRDVTDVRAAAVELKAARDAAEAASEAKSRFLASMSHEIRTPMNGILGMTSLLNDTELTPEQKTYGSAISSSAKTLLALIDEILDFSKIEAGKLELHAVPFSIEDTTQNVVELLAPRAFEKGLEVAWMVDPALPSSLLGDELRVRQILTNLLGNAIKFTDSGHVVVRVLTDGLVAGDATVSVSSQAAVGIRLIVEDSGIGLSPDAQELLFKEFVQAGGAGGQRRPGTGLGLAISRRLARAMGGDIEVTSEPGRGSVFSARLRLAADSNGSLAEQWLRPGSARRVLLALGRRTEERVVLDLLTRLGVEVEIARRDDIGELFGPRSGFCPNVILTDLVLDTSAAKLLLTSARQSPGCGEARGVVLVAAAERQRLKELRKAGFEAYLVRPVRVRSLLAQLCEPGQRPLAEKPAASASGMLTGTTHAARKSRVLLVEDNEIGALLATRMLEKAGCEVRRARDGAEALRSIERGLEPGNTPTDLVLMDVHMPGMNGLDATRAIKAWLRAVADVDGAKGNARSVFVPIVALTANAFAEDRKRCLEAGMDDFLTKPFDRSQLEGILEKWLGRRNAASGHGDIDGLG